MAKMIYVQAQADHIASLARATPLGAIEELVWNALDAGAREIKIDVLQNALGAVEGVRVSDDGTGIDVLNADSTFGSLGGSWKRAPAASSPLRRRLHGRHGCGRFKAFSLGTRVEWRTTMLAGGSLLSFVIAGALERPGEFEVKAAPPGPGPGTEVVTMNAPANCDSLLDASEAVQALAARFALYLASYPDVKIFYNGLPVTPLIVRQAETTCEVAGPNGASAQLKIIEWKKRFAGAGRLVFAGPDGFELYSRPCSVRADGTPFTAYLVSARLRELARENALVMDELNPEVRAYIDGAKAALKAHFAAAKPAKAAATLSSWIAEGSHPSVPAKDRERFDDLAIKLSRRMESLRTMSVEDRKLVFAILASAMHDKSLQL